MRQTRFGFVLPVVMVCGLLAISMVVTFQFISSSDYKQVGRLMRSAQATALADLASDEVSAKINEIKWGAGATKPAWVDPLLAALDGAKGGTTINVNQPLSFAAADYPLTAAQAGKSGLVKVDSVKGQAGPFEVLAGGGIDKGLIYKETLFGDDGKDLTAWDLRGPMSVEVVISGEGGPLAFSRTYRRGQQLAITDTTPPGRDFALMAYLPPHSADYAVQDLQKGGIYTVDPGNGAPPAAGRLMLRGPLLLIPEETKPLPAFPDKLHMGATNPLESAGQSQSYPDATWSSSLATVPGPRELQHPDNSSAGAGGELIGGVDRALLDIKTQMDPRRPGAERSDSTLRTVATPMTLTLDTTLSSPCPDTVTVPFTLPVLTMSLGEISPVLANDLSSDTATFDTIDKDVLAYYPPLAFFYAPLPPGQQRFRLVPTSTSLLQSATYRGVKVGFGGSSAALFTGTGMQEGDAVVTEPVPRSGQTDAENVGLIGLYGVAVQESKTYLNLDVLDVAKWLVQKGIDKDPNGNDKPVEEEIKKRAGGVVGGVINAFGGGSAVCGANPTRREIAQTNKDKIAQQALQQLGIDPSVKFLVRRFAEDAKLTLSAPVGLTASQLAGRLSNKEGAIAPFGAYFHDANFWRSDKVSQAAKDAIKKGLRDATQNPPDQAAKEALLNQLLPESGGTQVASLDSGWPVNGVPSGQTEGKTVRDFLCNEYSTKLLALTAAKGASDPGAALNALTANATKVRGIAEPRTDTRARPQGAFGPHGVTAAGTLPDVAELKTLFPRGTFPSKARDWEGMATRTYETFDDYVNTEKVGTTLELRGAVLVKSADSTQNIQYSGRGIVIVVTSDAGKTAKVGGTVTPVDPQSWLTLVHRVKPGLVGGSVPALSLGTIFTGTVLSETGIKPPGGGITFNGSLICGLLNKSASADGENVTLTYKADTVATMKDAWTVEASGEVSSVDPGP